MSLTTLLVFVLGLSIFANVADSQKGCSKKDGVWPKHSPCKFRHNEVFCKGMNSTIFLEELPINVTKLFIVDSSFELFNGSLFKNCRMLKHVAFLENSFTTISSQVFSDLNETLEILEIENNLRLELTHADIFNSIGKILHTLRIFKVKNGSQKIFEPLTSLHTLEIDGTVTGEKLGESFSKMIALKQITLKKFASNLTPDTFMHVNRCVNVTVNWGDMAHIHPETFSVLTELNSLDLSYNKKMNITDILPCLWRVSKSIKSLRLQYLVGLSNPTAYVTEEFFQVVSNMTNLTELCLSKNEILHLWWKVKDTPKSLKVFDISYNRLSNVFYLVSEFFVLTKLEILNISYQTKRYTPREDNKDDDFENEAHFIDGNESLQRWNLTRRLATRQKTDEHPGCIGKTDITCKFPRNPGAGDMDSFSWCIPCPRNLKVLRLNGAFNVYTKTLPTILVLGNCPIEEVQLTHNGILMCGGQLMIDRPKNTKPVTIDLSFNLMQCLSPDFLEYSLSRNLTLGVLFLQGNSLSDQLAKDEEGLVFRRYVDLTRLNLVDNKIKRLPAKIFSYLTKLENLNLSRNSLQVLEFDVSKLPNLKALDLSENLFVSLDVNQQALFSFMSRTQGYGNFIVSLIGNPMQCSCETMSFINWIISNTTKIRNFNRLDCLYYNKIVSLRDTSSIATDLGLFCYAALPLKIVGSLLGLGMICSLVGFIFYRYRWDVRYYILKKAQTGRERNLSTRSKNANYFYDAFVCYDKSDTSWVLQELLENLENPKFSLKYNEASTSESPESPLLQGETETKNSRNSRGQTRVKNGTDDGNSLNDDLKLCIHERDFEPGQEIETNILMAIENSRRIILVISKNFLKSRWCSLELEMAKMESLVRGVNLIVAIFLEPVEDSTKNLDWLTKYYTYLEWFQYDDYRRYEFWRRLRVSLGPRLKKRNLNQLNRSGIF